MSTVLLNGQLVAPEAALVSIFDRSVLFADAIYEVVAIYNGRMFRFDLHWDRFSMGATELGIEIPLSREDFLDRISALVAANMPDVGGVYFQLTRGAAPRTHTLPVDAVPTWFGFTVGPPASRDEGAAVITWPDNRFGLCYVKTTGLLPNSLARQAAHEAGAREAILVRDGLVTEASSSSVFAAFDGTLVTHPLANILPGITRQLVIDLAREAGIPVEEVACPLTRFRTADEAFITGTMSEVVPVTSVDGRPLGTGQPGPLTLKILGLYRDMVQRTIG